MHENGGNSLPPSQSNVVPSNPTLKPYDPSKQARIMENLKAAVLLRLANSHAHKALSAVQIAAIERGLSQAFPFFRTPTHPTYASMIQTAILKLNEKGGSMESSISEYVMANYEGLPWAHKSYLSHYLNKLCENGEIVCTSTNGYTLPDLIHEPKSKKIQLRPRPGRKRKEDVFDDEHLGGQELILMNEDEVCFQEEETQVFMRNRAKRRSSLAVCDEDEKVGGKAVVVRECNMTRGVQRAVIEEQSKLSELDQGDEVGKDSELRQHSFGTNDKRNDTVIMEEGLPETRQVVGCGGGVDQQVGSMELRVEKLVPEDGQDEVRAEVLPLERDQSSCAARWMIVPFKGDTSTPARQKEMKPVSKERKEIIVCGLPSAASMQPIRKSRVCRPKKRLKHCQKKSLLLLEKSVPASPVSFEGPKLLEHEAITKVYPQTGHETKLDWALLDSSKSKKSPLQTGEAHTSSPHETTPVIYVEEASLQLELEKQKRHLELSPPGGQQELMSTDDEDLNIPLQQVKQKCGKQRKLSEGMTTSKEPVALLSSVGAKLDAQPTASENTAVPQRNNKLTRSKRKKQGQQLKSWLRSQGQKCENLEADNTGACRSELLSSFQYEEGCNDGKGRHDEQDTHLADSLADGTADKCFVKYLHDQRGDSQVQGSSYLELMREIVPLDAQCRELGGNQHTMIDPGLSAEVEQASQVSLKETSQPWNQDGQKEECTQQSLTEMVNVASPDPEPVTAAYLDKKRTAENEEPQILEKQIKRLAGQGRWTPEGRPDHVAANLSSSAEPSRNLIIEAATVVCQLDQKKGEEPKNVEQIASLDFEATSTRGVVSDNSSGQLLISEPFSAKLGSQCQDYHTEEQQGKDESEAGLMDRQPPFAAPVKSERRGRPQKQKEETKDDSDSLNLRLQVQDVPPESASLPALSVKKNKGRKKDGRGRPRKQKQEIKDVSDSLNMQRQGQEAAAESAPLHLLYQRQNKWPKKDGRGRPRKMKEESKDVPAPLNEHDQLQKVSSEAAIHLIENNGHGSPRKQKGETTGDLAASLNSHTQKKGGSSEIAVDQSSLQQSEEQKRDGRVRPRKQNIVINKDAAVLLNLHSQEQEGLFRLAMHQHSEQQNKQLKRDGRGRPRKQNEMVNEDMRASLSLHHHQQEGLTHQHSQLQNRQPEGDGSFHKKSGATEEDAAVVVPLDQRLPEGSPESAVQQNKLRRRDSRGRPRKQDGGTKEDVGSPLNLGQKQKEGLPEPASHQMQDKKRKRDGRGRPLKKDAVTKEDVAAASKSDYEQLEGPSGWTSQQLNRQPKRVRRGRPRKLKGETNENEATLLHQQQELPMLAIHSALDASIVAHQLDQKEEAKPKETKHHINFPDSEIPLSLDNQSNQMPREQKQHRQGESYKAGGAGTSLDSQTLKHCQEGVLKSTPALVLTADEPHLEEVELHSLDEQPGKSQYQVHEMPSDQEQGALSSASGTAGQLMHQKEDRGGQRPRSKPEPLVEVPCQQEEERCQLHQETQGQLRDEGRTPKQKSAKTKAVEVPLASKAVLRSRIKRQSQSET